ncbi:MAG: 6-carboxytetrahydropterin synthase [Planctomycetes bacterium]|nr:6-carboxytetrahydropterin synthase [Planctomycetota bacterium]
MFTVSIETNFTSEHQLTLADGSKEDLHKHDWIITASVISEELDSDGFVINFEQLKKMVNDITAEFANTTVDKSAEKVAQHIYQKLQKKLSKNIKLNRVKVVEQPGCSATFS